MIVIEKSRHCKKLEYYHTRARWLNSIKDHILRQKRAIQARPQPAAIISIPHSATAAPPQS